MLPRQEVVLASRRKPACVISSSICSAVNRNSGGGPSRRVLAEVDDGHTPAAVSDFPSRGSTSRGSAGDGTCRRRAQDRRAWAGWVPSARQHGHDVAERAPTAARLRQVLDHLGLDVTRVDGDGRNRLREPDAEVARTCADVGDRHAVGQAQRVDDPGPASATRRAPGRRTTSRTSPDRRSDGPCDRASPVVAAAAGHSRERPGQHPPGAQRRRSRWFSCACATSVS